jgi:hypothetical protein
MGSRWQLGPRAVVAGVLALAAMLSGCRVAYRDHYDRATDRYREVRRTTESLASDRRVRYTVHTTTFLGDDLVEPVSVTSEAYDRLARGVITRMRLFQPDRVSRDSAPADYHFIFHITEHTTRSASLFSGLLLPFFRSRNYRVTLHVLDENGDPFATYAASSEVFEMRHFVLLPAAPFYLPGSAEHNARHNLFRSLVLQLIRDRKEFL